MTRRFTLALLAFSLLGACCFAPFVTSARADDFGFDVPVKPVVTPTPPPDKTTPDKTTPDKTTPDKTTPDKTTPDKTTPDKTTTATPADAPLVIPSVPKHPVPSRSFILDKVAGGDFDAAESAYLEWETAWQQMDPALLIAVESPLLQKQYTDGNDFNALVALLHGGDDSAMGIVRTMLRSGKIDPLTPEQFAVAVRALASRQESGDFELLMKLLQSKDPAMVDLGIAALGDYGHAKAIPAIVALLGDASMDRSVLIVKTMMKLRGKAQVIARYTVEMKSPLVGMPDRASVLIALSGSAAGWDKVKKILVSKTGDYYPQALSTLGSLPLVNDQGEYCNPAESYVTEALAGSDAEQLAAIASIDALTPKLVVPTLLKIINDKAKSDALHVAALNQLGEEGSDEAQKALRNYAFAAADVNSQVTVTALYLLADAGQLGDSAAGTALHQQQYNADKAIATAARGALLALAVNSSH